MESHGCCSPERQDDTPGSPHGSGGTNEKDDGCPCPVEIGAADDLPAGAVPTMAGCVAFEAQTLAPVPGVAVVLPRAELAEKPRCQPARGSPCPGRATHALNSVYLI
ncbi:MAG: hypothetical protein RLY93_12465 [Sumerlaeia bacterium]